MPEQANDIPRQLAIYEQLSGQPRQDFFEMTVAAGLDPQQFIDHDICTANSQNAEITRKREEDAAYRHEFAKREELKVAICSKALDMIDDNPCTYNYSYKGSEAVQRVADFRGEHKGQSSTFRLVENHDSSSNYIEIEIPEPEAIAVSYDQLRDYVSDDMSSALTYARIRLWAQEKAAIFGRRITIVENDASELGFVTEQLLIDRSQHIESGQDSFAAARAVKGRSMSELPAFVHVEYPYGVKNSEDEESIPCLNSEHLQKLLDMLNNARPIAKVEQKYLTYFPKFLGDKAEFSSI